MALAINSFPVPVSPRISTVESVGATLSTCESTWRSDSDDPTIVSYIEERSISSRKARISLRFRPLMGYSGSETSGTCRPCPEHVAHFRTEPCRTGLFHALRELFGHRRD